MADLSVKKYIYSFGGGRAEGTGAQKNLLGGKGANLAEMAGHPDLKLPVPPGFTLTTELCTYYYDNLHNYPDSLQEELSAALQKLEALAGKRLGDSANPLLLSIRSGARKSMPGMMDTVLNIGLNDETVAGLARVTNNPRFAWDAYRRLIMMFADVVMEKAKGLPPAAGKGVRRIMEEQLTALKASKNLISDTELSVEDLQQLVHTFKEIIQTHFGQVFPQDPHTQLWEGISAVFMSWNGKRAKEYRRIEQIPEHWGTAVNVQTMVFGNLDDNSATGVAFTRNPGNGEDAFYGEYLINAQGEDVVAGIRTPAPLNEYSKNDQSRHLPSLESTMLELYRELHTYRDRLERHFRDMQDIEFTIEAGTLYMLQCRVGKRNGAAAIRMAMDMFDSGWIDADTALMRVAPQQLVELLLPMLDPEAEKSASLVGKGLPAGPGGAVGKIVFCSEDALEWAKKGEPVILVREDTSPEDVDGMHVAQGILTSKGGMTSHAALVARGWGRCCIVGCNTLDIDEERKTLKANGKVWKEGDIISMNGSKGLVFDGAVPLVRSSVKDNQHYHQLMRLTDQTRTLQVRANAETPGDARQAREFGAEGIGLFRTEHMFYGEGSEIPLHLMRQMILSEGHAAKQEALDTLFGFVKKDIKDTLQVMDGLPVTIRLLDPPLHEFVPHDEEKLAALAKELGISLQLLRKRVLALHENNPMLGHRGVRLGISYPEITQMQLRAIFEASAELMREGLRPHPEIMVPVTCTPAELEHQQAILEQVYAAVLQESGLDAIPYHYGTMIETPRAALQAGEMARVAEFFSFGTNDLTQMTFGFSRDDIGGFLPTYLEKGILTQDPFQTLDQRGVGELILLAASRARAKRPDIMLGICGEHGGDPDSVGFCHRAGLDYVSCSPFRIPIARLAAAHAAIASRKTAE